MPKERVLSSYILRLTQQSSRLGIELRDVRTGHSLRFASFEQLLQHLSHNVGPTAALPPKGRPS